MEEFDYFLKHSAPNILKKKISALNIKSFDQLLNTRVDTFLQLKSFGKKCVTALEDLKKDILENNLNQTFVFDPKKAVFEIEAFIENYFMGAKDPKLKTIFERRIVEENITLEELGFYFSITRERIRQIENELRNKLSDALTNRYYGKKKITPHKNLSYLLNQTKEYLDQEQISNKDDLC